MKLIFDRNKKAIAYKEKEYSYKEIITGIKYFATLIDDVVEDDKVVVTMENRPEMISSIYSVWDKKGTTVILDAGYNEEQYIYALGDCSPKYIFTSKDIYPVLSKAVEKLEKQIKIIVVDEVVVPNDFVPKNYEVVVEDIEKVAVILYTSGTTGNPKGVMLTFRNLESNLRAVKDINIVTEKDNVLAILPYHHILPLNITLLMPMYFGTFLVILDELSSDALKKNLKKYEITVVVGVPRIWEMLHKGIMGKINSNKVAKHLFTLCKKINSMAFGRKIFNKVHQELGGNLKILVSGGAKLDSEVANNFKTLGFNLIEGYGLTETSPIITFNRPTNNVIGTVGEVIEDVEVKLGEDGEVLVKGANVMKGYYNKPEETAKAIDEDGWFHTGDLGEFRGKSLVIIGRKKEMIVLSNGKNINPNDIENEIMRYSNLIKELAVIEYNNHLMAVVFPDFDLIRKNKITNIKETLKWEIIDKYNTTAPNYRKILEIKVVKEELPKTKLGKIRRFLLNDFIKNNDINSGEKVEVKKEEISIELKENFEKLKNYIDKTYNVELEPSSHLELDLGLDSLDMVEILAYIESNFNVRIDEETFSCFKNAQDIVKYINENGGNFSEEELDWNKILNQDIDLVLPKSSILTKLSKILFAPIFWIYFRARITGKENIKSSPYIIAGNHQSYIDAFLVTQSLSLKTISNTYYVATIDQFNTPIRKFVANYGNVITIDINKNLKDTLQIIAQVLRQGKNIVIFPEGARSRDGEMAKFKKAFAILSKELGIKVLPFGIDGAYEAYPHTAKFPKPIKLYLNLFEEVEPTNLEVDEIVTKCETEIKDWLENK